MHATTGFSEIKMCFRNTLSIPHVPRSGPYSVLKYLDSKMYYSTADYYCKMQY